MRVRELRVLNVSAPTSAWMIAVQAVKSDNGSLNGKEPCREEIGSALLAAFKVCYYTSSVRE